MAAKLTPLQQEFLKQLFGPCNGNVKKAAEAVGIDDYSSLMTGEMADAIRARADNELVLNAAKAVFTLKNILENPEATMFSDKLHKVASDILDRVGLGRVERSTSSGLKIGLVILPDKLPVKDANFEVIEKPKEMITNDRVEA